MEMRIGTLAGIAVVTLLALGCTTPTKIEVSQKEVVLDKAGKTALLEARVLDQDGSAMSIRGLEIRWSCEETGVARVTPDGQVTAVASGDADVKVEVVGTALSEIVKVEVKIPKVVHVSKDKLRLFEGESKEDIWAEVQTERGAFVEGAAVTWSSDDSSVVKVEPVVDPTRRRQFVRLTGVTPGTTHAVARHGTMSKSVRVSVFASDQEVNLAGSQISKKKARDAKRYKKKKVKPRRIEF